MIEVGENIKQEGAAVALLQETRLEDKRKLIVKGMIAFKSSERVGTAVCIQERIRAERIPIKGVTLINYTVVKIRRAKESIMLMSIYVPVNCARIELEDELRIIIEATDHYDFNARYTWWNAKPEDPNNSNGAVLANVLRDFPEVVLKSTCDNTFRGISKLDHFLVNRRTEREGVRVVTGNSTWCHLPIILTSRMRKAQMEERQIPTRESF